MESFNDIIKGEMPVLVDFFATWCGPCKAITPAITELGHQVQGKARVLKIDIDKNQALAEKFEIRMVPTFIIFKNGEPAWRFSGVTDKASLLKEIENHI